MSADIRAAIVTGASRGIGAAIAARLAADGFHVVVNYASGQAEASEVVAGIEAKGGAALAVQADIADPRGISVLFDAAESSFGAVAVLVNNAGVLRTSPLVNTTDADYEHQLTVNLNGTFYGLREGARRVRDGGRIVSLSTSIVGTYLPAHGVYAATKAAVEALTRVLAKELGPRNITVNAVSPGPVATDFFLTGRSQDLIDKLTAEIPLGRLGEPDDVARVVSFLAGPDGGWVSGQVIRANGGRN